MAPVSLAKGTWTGPPAEADKSVTGGDASSSSGASTPTSSASNTTTRSNHSMADAPSTRRPASSKPNSTPVPAGRRRSRVMWRFLRSLFIEAPLSLIFVGFVASASLLYIYDTYVTEILLAAKWRETNRLPNEYTYYKRECLREDMTTFDATDLVIRPNATAEQSTQQMMRHGFGLIGSVLTPDTTAKLREFVMKRNAELTPAEAIPLDGEHNRWSFAIGAAEDPIVATALREVATHPVVRPMLETLLGPDPAVVEITAITSAYGAQDQGWHADVKPLGNAVRYARTFTHSYSLFTTLQDTTGPMGATEVCPGTHYCANDLVETCLDDGFKVTKDGTESGGVWKAGDSLLLNQCAWHRGTSYTDPNDEHRVVFIVTFLSRPRFGVDNRQLSHGTYFHIRWDMWGHTLNDLLDAKKFMSAPWAAMRSAGIWKPKDRRWGWDWLTVACLRIANDQNGYNPYDLVEWVNNFDLFGLPHFLRGPVSADKGFGWQAFIRGTLERFAICFGALNLAILLVYLFLTKCIYSVQYYWSGGRDSGLFRAVLKRLLLCYGLIVAVASCAHFQIYQSPWAESIRSKRFLMRPFPTPSSVETRIRRGPTTVPSVYDVLVGSRFDSRDIGAYNGFLDYHPGNLLFSTLIDDCGDGYSDSPALQGAYVSSVVEKVSANNHGRFLQQNELGHWMRMSRAEAAAYTKRELIKKGATALLNSLDQEISFLVADARHGPFRGSALMQRYGLNYLDWWRDRLLLSSDEKIPTNEILASSASRRPIVGLRSSLFAIAIATPTRSKTLQNARRHPFLRGEERRFDPSSGEVKQFSVGDHVEANFDSHGVWFEARIRSIGEVEEGVIEYDVEYADGDIGVELMDNVRPYWRPFEEGDRIKAEIDEIRWCDATIEKVSPGRTFDIRCDDNISFVGMKYDRIKRITNP